MIVAVTSEDDPSLAAGVGTLDLVLPVGTFLAQVTAEVTLKTRPLWY